MSFGEKIKNLRHNSNMTQEKLAELLSISPQAVSRWETDVAMPDISLLPPLANLFDVTTDYLLGMDTYQKDLRKAEFDEAFFEYWKHEDKEKNYQIAVKAVAEYPGNMEYVEWLASAEYYVSFLRGNDEFNRLLSSSVDHYRLVIENTNESEVKNKALYGIVLSLCYLNRKEEAKEYAKLVDDKQKQNELLCWCLEGDEKKKHCQEVTENLLNRFLFQLTFENRTVEAFETVEKILEIVFPDGNYQYYHNTLQYDYLSKSHIYVKSKEYDLAIESLQKSKYHALQMTECIKNKNIQFTAPLFNLVCGKYPENETGITDFDDFIKALNTNSCYDPLREREDFKELYNI